MLSHPNTKTLLSTVASLAASAMLIRSIANDLIPNEVRSYFFSSFHNLSRRFSSRLTIVIEEFQGPCTNQMFEAADSYLGTKVTPSVQRIRVGKAEKEKKLAISMDKNEETVDVFENIQVRWRLICTRVKSSRHISGRDPLRLETRSYELSFHQRHKENVLNSYLPYILERSKAIKQEREIIKIHSVFRWDVKAANLDHPMTFETLAMDSELKKALVDDLNDFMKGKEFYRKIGKAWKRGYLLYGPPGTGKSSLIAAMANHLNYDVYDLDLTEVESNSDLRYLFLSMSNRLIIVIEDIDCSIKLQNRESGDEPGNYHDKQKVTLSGLLNFMDGLWSCCGDERIIVLTTNYKDRIDPALLRPGRMDMHIHMTYCTISAFKQLAYNYLGISHHELFTISAFKQLAYNYLGISHHELFEQIEGLIRKVEVTTAEVAGELMKSTDAEVALQGLVTFLHNKISEYDKEKIEQQENQIPTRKEEGEDEVN